MRGKGNLNVELVIRCSRDDEVVVGLMIYGKAENTLKENKLKIL